MPRNFEARGSLENPSTDLYAALTGMFDSGVPANSGAVVNPQTAMRVITVMACVRVIAETIGMLPLNTVKRSGKVFTLANSPQEAYIWKKPNPEMTRQFMWETIAGHLCLAGNAFIYKVYDKLDRLVEIWPVDPRTITVHRADGAKVFRQNGDVLTEREICHIPAFSTDGFVGLNPIQQARETIGIAIAAEEYGARFYSQGATLSGIISVQEPLDDESASRMARRFGRIHGGSRNAHKVAVLDNNAKWQSVGLAPADAQFLEVRKFTNMEIAKLYRVPPHLIGEVDKSTSWGTGIEQQNQAFVIYTVGPYLTRIETKATDDLLPRDRSAARFDLDALLRGTAKDRWAVYTQMRNLGTYNNDEIRGMEGDAPIPGDEGSDYHQPLNSSAAQGGATKADGTDKQDRQPGDTQKDGPTDD